MDNDSVAALTKALKEFKGAVLAVSENEAFTAEISNEKWVVENGSVTIVQCAADCPPPTSRRPLPAAATARRPMRMPSPTSLPTHVGCPPLTCVCVQAARC